MEERKQKTSTDDYPQGRRLETGNLMGVQTFMDITESGLVEVKIDAEHLMEAILSTKNLNDAYRRVKANGGSGGVDGMRMEELLPYLKTHGQELRESILNGKYKPSPVRRVEIPKDNKLLQKLW